MNPNLLYHIIENAFTAGTNWKEKYKKIVDDDIEVPDFDKYFEELLKN